MSLTVASIVTMAAVFSVVYLAFIEYNSISATEQSGNENNNHNNDNDAVGKQAKAKRDKGYNAPKRSKRHFKQLFRWNIEPGTKWCGPGNVADHEEDFGKFEVEDRCCRTHDRCKLSIASGGKMTFYTKDNASYDVVNDGPYTVSSCECDDEFRDCLEAADSKKSDSIGWWFFLYIRSKCLANNFMQRDPICVEWGMWGWGPCIKYETPEPELRWFLRDPPDFELKDRLEGEDAKDDAMKNETVSTSNETGIPTSTRESHVNDDDYKVGDNSVEGSRGDHPATTITTITSSTKKIQSKTNKDRKDDDQRLSFKVVKVKKQGWKPNGETARKTPSSSSSNGRSGTKETLPKKDAVGKYGRQTVKDASSKKTNSKRKKPGSSKYYMFNVGRYKQKVKSARKPNRNFVVASRGDEEGIDFDRMAKEAAEEVEEEEERDEVEEEEGSNKKEEEAKEAGVERELEAREELKEENEEQKNKKNEKNENGEKEHEDFPGKKLSAEKELAAPRKSQAATQADDKETLAVTQFVVSPSMWSPETRKTSEPGVEITKSAPPELRMDERVAGGCHRHSGSGLILSLVLYFSF